MVFEEDIDEIEDVGVGICRVWTEDAGIGDEIKDVGVGVYQQERW